MLAVMQSHTPELSHPELAAQSSSNAKTKGGAASSGKSSAVRRTRSGASTPQMDAPRPSKAANATTGGSQPRAIAGKKGKGPAQQQHEDDVFSCAQMLSKSAPSSTAVGTAASRKGNRKGKGGNIQDSADPQWDMPDLPPSVALRQAGQDEASSTALTWQQQLLASSMNKASSSDGTANERKRNKNQQAQLAKEGKKDSNGSAKTRDQHKGDPAAAGSASASSGLTWQQQTLASSADQGSRPREAKGQKFDSPNKAQRSTQDQQNKRGTAATGTKPSTPSKPSSKSVNDLSKSQSVSDTSSSLSGPMYAGPSFHSSPSPASLPAPSFARQRPVSLTNEQSVNLSSSSSNNSYNQQQYSSSPLRHSLQDQSHLLHPHFAPPAEPRAGSFPKAPTTAPLTPSSDWPAYPAQQPASDSSSSGDGSANDSAKQQTIETLLARLMR